MTDPGYAGSNRRVWSGFAPEYAAKASRAWTGEPAWGIWGIPESDVQVLPESLAGKRCLELGCGTGYVSAWLTRRGAWATGLDPTPEQLATARTMQARHGPEFPLVEAFAERLPFADGTFDLAISEYGAALWSDPYLWLPEASRVLKPDAELIFLTNAALAQLCMPEVGDDRPMQPHLLRPYLGMHRTDWEDTGEIEFHITHGAWIDLLRAHGFQVVRLLELGAPPGATTSYTWASAEWARHWPTEEIWIARRP